MLWPLYSPGVNLSFRFIKGTPKQKSFKKSPLSCEKNSTKFLKKNHFTKLQVNSFTSNTFCPSTNALPVIFAIPTWTRLRYTPQLTAIQTKNHSAKFCLSHKHNNFNNCKYTYPIGFLGHLVSRYLDPKNLPSKHRTKPQEVFIWKPGDKHNSMVPPPPLDLPTWLFFVFFVFFFVPSVDVVDRFSAAFSRNFFTSTSMTSVSPGTTGLRNFTC